MKPNNGAFNDAAQIIGEFGSRELPPLMTPVVVRESHGDAELYDWLIAREVAVERLIDSKDHFDEGVRNHARLGYDISTAAVRARKVELGIAEPLSVSRIPHPM